MNESTQHNKTNTESKPREPASISLAMCAVSIWNIITEAVLRLNVDMQSSHASQVIRALHPILLGYIIIYMYIVFTMFGSLSTSRLALKRNWNDLKSFSSFTTQRIKLISIFHVRIAARAIISSDIRSINQINHCLEIADCKALPRPKPTQSYAKYIQSKASIPAATIHTLFIFIRYYLKRTTSKQVLERGASNWNFSHLKCANNF